MSLAPALFRYLDHFGRTCRLDRIATPRGWLGKRDWVALRHDIDHDLDLALELAYHEHQRGIRATYFLLHTAGYWDDPDLLIKCRQLHEYGHEVGLHLDLVTEIASGQVTDPQSRIAQLLTKLRGSGVRVRGVAAHGAKACYAHRCTNFWFWKELRPSDPMRSEHLRSAEGIRVDDPNQQIPYPNDHRAQINGASIDLWSVSMKQLGLRYEASAIKCDRYWTDTGGSWNRSPDPIGHDLSKGRHVVLMHPIWWRASKKVHFVMCTDPQTRSRMSSFVNAATPASVLDEWTLTHNRVGTRIDPVERPLQLTPTLISNAIAHHTKLIDSDAVELSSLMTPAMVADRIGSDGSIQVWNVRTPSSRLHDSASDLLREHPSLYRDPGDPPLFSMDAPRWAWLSRHQRAVAHIKASRHEIDAASTISGRDTGAMSRALADRLGLVVHPLLADIQERSSAQTRVIYPTIPLREGSLWATARRSIRMGGRQLGASILRRSVDVQNGREVTLQWNIPSGSAPQASVEFRDLLKPGEYLLGLLKIVRCLRDPVRVFFHSWNESDGERTTVELGELRPGTGSVDFRFACAPPEGSDRFSLSLLVSKDHTKGSLTLRTVELRVAQLDEYHLGGIPD